jgi:hypothetical protein
MKRKVLLSLGVAGGVGAIYFASSKQWGDVAFGRIIADLGYYSVINLSNLPRILMAPKPVFEPLPPSKVTADSKISGIYVMKQQHLCYCFGSLNYCVVSCVQSSFPLTTSSHRLHRQF